MATLQRRYQPVRATQGASRHRAATAEAGELELGGVHSAFPVSDRPRPMDAASVLALQRTHGNAHVQRLIARAPLPALPPVGAFPEEELNSVELYEQRFALHRLFPRKITPFVRGLNQAGERVIDDVRQLVSSEATWSRELEVIHTHDGKGAKALQTVQGAAKTLSAKTSGRSGEYASGRIEAYLDAISAANQAVSDMRRKQEQVDIAVGKLHTASLAWDEKQQGRVVKDLEGKVAKKQKEIEQAKATIKGVIGLTKSFIDPTKWVSITLDVGIFLGKEVVDRGIDSWELAKLKQQLGAAQKKLQDIEDAKFISIMETAGKELDKARGDAADAKALLKDRLSKVRRMQRKVVQALDESRSTRGAGAAIAERGMVIKTSMDAQRHLQDYLGQFGPSLERLQNTQRLYRSLAKMADENAPGKRPISQDEAIHLHETSMRNSNTLEMISTSIRESRDYAQDRLAYLAKGEFLAGYEEIPTALGKALE